MVLLSIAKRIIICASQSPVISQSNINLLSFDTVTSLIICKNNVFIRHNLGLFEGDGKTVKIGREKGRKQLTKKDYVHITCAAYSSAVQFLYASWGCYPLYKLYN